MLTISQPTTNNPPISTVTVLALFDQHHVMHQASKSAKQASLKKKKTPLKLVEDEPKRLEFGYKMQ